MILNNRPAAIITVFKDVKKICSQQIKKEKNRNSKQRNRNYFKKRQKM